MVINTIIKIIGGIYFVYDGEKVVQSSIRKNVQKDRIVVGDRVEIEENAYDKGKYIINKVLTRNNFIPRPPIANIDKLLILIAPKPAPDFLLVDKLIIYCFINNIEPVLIVNKSDLITEDFVDKIKEEYYFMKVFFLSAINNSNIESLTNYLSGSISAVCGQSAVGKSSLINALIPTLNLETGELSAKIERGKHTTRVNELHLYNDLMIIDTPGFSNLDINIDYDELEGFYPEFNKYLGNCKYLDCSHVGEGYDCEIIKAVNSGEINKNRYDRFVELYKLCKEKWEKKYD
jgi:ribosome biogenesis GTPase